MSDTLSGTLATIPSRDFVRQIWQPRRDLWGNQRGTFMALNTETPLIPNISVSGIILLVSVKGILLMLQFFLSSLTCQSGRRPGPACPSPRLWPAPASCTRPRQRSGGTWSMPAFPHMLLQHTDTNFYSFTCLIRVSSWAPTLDWHQSRSAPLTYQSHRSQGPRWWRYLAESLQERPLQWSSPHLGWWSGPSPYCLT